MRFSSLFVPIFILIHSTLKVSPQETLNNDQVIAFFNNGAKITLWDITTNTSHSPVTNEEPIVTFDYHFNRQLLFWATNSVIYRCSIGTNVTSSVCVASKRELIAHVGRVGGLCVDWIHDKLYWTDLAAGQVEAAALDGSNRTVLYNNGRPSTIAVDPLLGRLFWIDDSPFLRKLRYTYLDGSYHKQGFAWQSAPVLWESEELSLQSPLLIEPSTGTLYFVQIYRELSWIMAVNHQLKTIKLKFICSGNMTNFNHFEEKVYWTDKQYVCWSQNHSVKNELQINLKAKQVKLYSVKSQPTQEDQCENNDCEDNCFVVNKLPSCSCNFGSDLEDDFKSCSEPDYYLLHTTNSVYRLALSSKSMYPFPKTQLLWFRPGASIVEMDVHKRKNLLFWTNNQDAIFVSLLQRPWEVQVFFNVTAKSLTVDWLHDLVYWTEDTSVWMATLDGKSKWLVAQDPNKPYSITVDPVNRLLFWSTCGWEMLIIRSQLDGSDRSQLVTSNISCASSLTADSERKRLHWVDRTKGTTSSIYYDGRIRHNIHDPRVKTVSPTHDKLIWTSASDNSLFFNESAWSKEVKVGFLPAGVIMLGNQVEGERDVLGADSCKHSGCEGLCVPGPLPDSWKCLCPQGQYLADDNTTCHSFQAQPLVGSAPESSVLSVVDYNSSSVTLLVDSANSALVKNYVITLEPISSYQSKYLANEAVIKYKTKEFPVTVGNLSVATRYRVIVEPQPTYLGVWKEDVSTAPPSMPVIRLPQVFKPWDPQPITWELNNTDDHFDISTSWQPAIKEFILLMVPTGDISNLEELKSIVLPRVLLDRIDQKLKSSGVNEKFVVIQKYESIVIFDQDSELHLTNTPFGMEFFLIFCQVSEFSGSFGIEIVISEKTEIPWPIPAK